MRAGNGLYGSKIAKIESIFKKNFNWVIYMNTYILIKIQKILKIHN